MGRFDRLLFLAALAAVLAGCSHQTEEPSAAAPPENAPENSSRVRQASNGEVIVRLDPATQQVMGLQTAVLQPALLSPELKGYGRVLEISRLAALAAELTTARAASQASGAELERLQTLAVQSNASERALQAAEAAAVRDRVEVESIRLRLLANWGRAISEQRDLAGFVQSLASLESALIEIELPAGEHPDAAPTGARLLTLSQGSQPIDAQFLGPAPTVTPMQGRGYLFLVDPNAQHLAPGATVTGFLILPGTPQAGVLAPRNAVVHFNGATWVYVQTGDETFRRTEVALEAPLKEGWFVRERLKPEEKVVVVGAQELLSEERKGEEME